MLRSAHVSTGRLLCWCKGQDRSTFGIASNERAVLSSCRIIRQVSFPNRILLQSYKLLPYGITAAGAYSRINTIGLVPNGYTKDYRVRMGNTC